jgi:tRNA threonylcarbamoyl adenosine modification protein (Sua5/YciO/YrdC/YwlC family)
MSLLKILSLNPPYTEQSIAAGAQALKVGHLIVLPTDTVYGIAGAADTEGERKLFEAKTRGDHKPIPILASGLDAVEAMITRLGALERRLAHAFWPGPLTLVLETPQRPEGFRVPALDTTIRLIAAAGGLIRCTSANMSGQPPALTAAEATRTLGHRVAVILDGGPALAGVPSTVAQVINGRIQILREGALTRQQLENACRMTR